jgi:hypothetical protein
MKVIPVRVPDEGYSSKGTRWRLFQKRVVRTNLIKYINENIANEIMSVCLVTAMEVILQFNWMKGLI